MSVTKISETRFMFKDVIPDDSVTTAPPAPVGKHSSQSEFVNDARKKMVERHRNAWKQGQDNG